MRDYQKKKNNGYYLPPSLYKRILETVRDYERQKEYVQTAEQQQNQSADNVIAKNTNDIKAMEQAFFEIPEQYRQLIIENIKNESESIEIKKIVCFFLLKSKVYISNCQKLKLAIRKK